MFLVFGVIAGVLHLAGVAAVTGPMSGVLLLTGILLGAIYVITGRTDDRGMSACPTNDTCALGPSISGYRGVDGRQRCSFNQLLTRREREEVYDE